MIYIDVDVAQTELPVNMHPLVGTDGATIDEGVVYNEAGIDLNWNFITTAGSFTQTNVVPTTAGLHDWTHQGNGMYTLEVPASGGTINNDAEGAGWFTGNTTATLPWRSETYTFRGAPLNDALIDGGDNLDVNTTLIEGTDATDQLASSLTAIGLDHLVSASVTGTDIADNSIIAQLVDNAATADWDNYDNTLQSLKAIVTRGDSAWTTGGGGSLTQAISWSPIGILQGSGAMDVANTKSWRGGIAVNNSLDDLPTTAEITPGTYSIDRAAQGGTTWTSVLSDVANSESAGLVYFDEVFDTATTYAAGDVVRITLKSISVTADANTYEICDTTGMIFYCALIANNPPVDIASIDGDTANVAALNLFAASLNPGTGQIDSGTLANDTITANIVQDGAFTSTKFGTAFITSTSFGTDAVNAAALAADAVTEIQSGLALEASVTGVQATADAIEVDTQDIQARLPAALNNGAIIADMQRINDVALVGDGAGTPFEV